MTDQEFAALAKILCGITDAVGHTQAVQIANHHILRELVIMVSRQQPDPGDFCRSMFRSVTATLEQGGLSHKPKVDGDINDTLELFFTHVLNAVTRS